MNEAVYSGGAETTCADATACGSNCAPRSCVQGSDAQPCFSRDGNGPTISSSSKIGWGGPRANAGGPRANSGGARPNSGGPRANSGGVRPGAGGPRKRIIQARPLGPRWHVAEIIQRDSDAIVRDLLEGETRPGYQPRQPFGVYQPTTAVERLIRGQKQVVHRAMFPGYLFIQFDRQVDDWPAVKAVEGVRTIFATRSLIPIPLPPGFVEGLVDDAPNRLRLPRVKLPCFEPGQALKVEEGPFSGFAATCVECDGLLTVALVHIFGRDTRVEFQRRMFSAAPVHAWNDVDG